jgi:hypothetical protein
MSSPKRVARRANGKRAAKTAARGQAVAMSAKPAGNGASVGAKRLAAMLERSITDGKLDLVSTDALQKLIAAACRVYSARTEAGEQFTPVPKHSISATDVMLTASGLLRAADLAVFELGMWQSWTGR